MAKKKVIKKKAVKKAVKKNAAKKTSKKSAKKAAPKKAKKAAKKVVKKVAKKATKKVAKKVVKKSAPKKAVIKKTAIIKVKRPRITKSPVVVHTSITPSSHSAIENLVHSSSDSNHSLNHIDNNSESTQENSKDSNDQSNSESSEEKSEGERIVPHCTSLKEGDVAPYFEGVNQFGNTIKSTDFSNVTLILYFYPKDFTGGCTAESCSLRDEHNYLENNSYSVVGVSADDVDSHRRFAHELSLPFSLIADTDKKMIKAFDVWGMKKSGEKFSEGIVRTTFIISPDGKIKNVITNVDSVNAAQQILSLQEA